MIVHGFELIRELDIHELNTHARWFRHVETGAELISMENDDENKVFAVTFRTPPHDSTGVAHILEHSVLNGSRKYPVKAPFDQMAKSSLKTFINAMTFPDKTSYPVASQNLQDFYNLMDVYLDSVFNPRIAPETLEQEGWHLELNMPDQPLSFKGVVFNEMKGVYSSPDASLDRYARRSVFPDNAYGLDSGGDPREIPDLTYEQFRGFYERYYHPSNARVWFYGDDPADERLRRVDEYLRGRARVPVDSAIGLQPCFGAPKHLTHTYAASDGVAGRKRSMFVVNWLLPDPLDAERTLAFQILTHVLIGTPASPLRKALIDSQLGEELTGSGLDSSLRQMYFGIGLKNIAAADADAVESLILNTLGAMSRDGIARDVVDAALNTIEFRLRENNTGFFPRGIALMFRSLTLWLYGGDPFALLAFEGPLADVKRRVAMGEPLFENLIREHFVQNPHRTTVLLQPDTEHGAREDAEERARLGNIRARMNAEQLEAVVDRTRELRRMQETPDTPEALATLPVLRLSDVDRFNKRIPLAVTRAQDTTVLYHDLFTNGIVYLDIGFDLRALPQELLPYVSLFGRALLEMGTRTEDFTRLALRIAGHTGGIGRSALASLAGAEVCAWLFLRGKATMAQAGALLDILRDVLLTLNLDRRERFTQIVLQEKARQEAGLIPAGSAVAVERLKSRFNLADWAGEQMGGVSYLFFLRELSEALASDWPSVLQKLEAVRSALINRANLLCNVTLDAANYTQFAPLLADLLAALPMHAAVQATWTVRDGKVDEGLTIPSLVNYVAKGDNLFQYGYRASGSIAVITHLIARDYVRERVRVQGGAYGGGCSFDRHTGLLTFSSYRDPNLLKTVANFDGAGQFLRATQIDDEELSKHIIGVIGQIDTYMLPDAKGFTSMLRYLLGDTDEVLQRWREEILSTSVGEVRQFADMLEQVAQNGRVVALGSPDAIGAASEERNGRLQVTKVL